MKHRKMAAALLKQRKAVALYCDGLYSDSNILYLDKFYGVRPSVVVDNDTRKKGTTLFGVPIMPYAEAKTQFADLHYYIQGNTYQYAVIGDLLADGVDPGHIINYVPVEKREGCLIAETSIGIVGDSSFRLCYNTDFCHARNTKTISFSELTVDGFNRRFADFRDNNHAFIQADGSDCRAECPMHRTRYYAVEPKIRLIGDYISDYCELACRYCFLQELGMNNKPGSITFQEWLSVLLQSNAISDALVAHLCPTEKTIDEDMEKSLAICKENINAFESVNLFSCCYAYREGMIPLLEAGAAKSFWSLDAGTEETFEKIKRKKGALTRVLDNVDKYFKADAFGGASIIPKFSVSKGINDNEADIDGFIEICKRYNCRYCAMQWDFSDTENVSEQDLETIRYFYKKITDAGLKATYTSSSAVMSKALGNLAFYEDKK